MKLKYILAAVFIVLSFYLTDKSMIYIRSKNPIMQEIINNYLDWFKASTIITPIESADKETVKVSTMFLDSHKHAVGYLRCSYLISIKPFAYVISYYRCHNRD